jgi:chloramphenicol 3-O phosphotransferase
VAISASDAAARAEHSRPAVLLSMEPHPPDRGPGRIIFLNGASSSGTSTLAKAMQEPLPEPFPHVSPDHLGVSGMLPAQCDPDGPFGWWQQMRPRFFDGFHRCPPALAVEGNDLIVEHIIGFGAWREYLATLLDGPDVFLVGVYWDLAEIDRRERDRGDRRTGEGRSHVETDLIHTFGPYDVGTTNTVPSAVAAAVLAAWRAATRQRALWQGISGNRGILSVPAATGTRRGRRVRTVSASIRWLPSALRVVYATVLSSERCSLCAASESGGQRSTLTAS